MRFVLILAAGLAATQNLAFGQTQPTGNRQPLTIYSVHVQPFSGELTIAGRGFGTTPIVSVDGHSVTVLPGNTDTRIMVLAPASVLTVPGTYRLTVLDLAGQQGDVFTVTAHPEGLDGDARPAEHTSQAASSARNDSSETKQQGAKDRSATARGAAVSPSLTESGSVTALGLGAFAFVTTGTGTAIGVNALGEDRTGIDNTAVGTHALRHNTGALNAAIGAYSLQSNNGSRNTATGGLSLLSNVGGSDNTATGYDALRLNWGGYRNVASGSAALRSNYLGSDNTASGKSALENSLGDENTAIGARALFSNTTGHRNTAVGYQAGSNATTGSSNIFLGTSVTGVPSDGNTLRIGLPYDAATGSGQNRAFMAGVYGTQLTGVAHQVFVDANGQLGTLTPGLANGGGTIPPNPLQTFTSLRVMDSLGNEVGFYLHDRLDPQVLLELSGLDRPLSVRFNRHGYQEMPVRVWFQSSDCTGPGAVLDSTPTSMPVVSNPMVANQTAHFALTDLPLASTFYSEIVKTPGIADACLPIPAGFTAQLWPVQTVTLPAVVPPLVVMRQ